MGNLERAIKLFEDAMTSRNKETIIIKRKFKMTIEDLQDRPSSIKEEIITYLEEHADKIDRLEIESEVDEDTFAPSIVLRMHTKFDLDDRILKILENV